MQEKLFIDGQWVDGIGGAKLAVVNPATEQVFHEVAAAGGEDVNRAVQAATAAFPSWSKTRGAERSVFLRGIGQRIRERREPLAKLEVLDNGKPLPETIKVQIDGQDLIAMPTGGAACPSALLPQHATEPSSFTPQVWLPPARTLVNVPPTGTVCPASFAPQHATEPSTLTPQA